MSTDEDREWDAHWDRIVEDQAEHAAADWAITEGGGVSDRFLTRAEAEAALAEGGYPEGSVVEYVEDPNPMGDDGDDMAAEQAVRY